MSDECTQISQCLPNPEIISKHYMTIGNVHQNLRDRRQSLSDPSVAPPGAADHKELAFKPAGCSFCEGMTLRFIVLRVSTLARIDTESTSASTLLRVALAR